MIYKKTYWLNIMSAVFWLVIFASLILNHMYEAGGKVKNLLFGLAAIHIFLIGIFSLTAYVIKTDNKQRLNLFSGVLN